MTKQNAKHPNSHDRRQILERIIERISSMSDKELESTLDQSVNARADAGEVRRAIFHEAANRKLAAVAQVTHGPNQK
jgi:hypothetical protein